MKKCYLLLVFTILSFSIRATAEPIENLAFEGAGIRGLAYSGVVLELEKQQHLKGVKRVAGTSAGAITALLISIGYSSKEMEYIVSSTAFEKFNDRGVPFFGGLSRFFSRFGWYRTRKFKHWIHDVIESKTNDGDMTFAELRNLGYKDLYITATCLNRQKTIVLSADTYPNMKLKDAVCISMSIPLYFEASFVDVEGNVHKKQDQNGSLDVMIDGGMLCNFPIEVFDSTYTNSEGKMTRIPNPKTLGIRIDSDEQILLDKGSHQLSEVPVHNFSDYMLANYTLLLETTNRNKLTEEDWKRTISVSNASIGPRIKKLKDKQRQDLLRAGVIATKVYLEQKL